MSERLKKEHKELILKKAIMALEKIDRWWDISETGNLRAAFDDGPGFGPYKIRNDSMAAGSIIHAKNILKEIKEYE